MSPPYIGKCQADETTKEQMYLHHGVFILALACTFKGHKL